MDTINNVNIEHPSLTPLTPVEEDSVALVKADWIRNRYPLVHGHLKRLTRDDLKILSHADSILGDPVRLEKVRAFREKRKTAQPPLETAQEKEPLDGKDKINQAGSRGNLIGEETKMGKSPAFQFYVNDWLGSPNIMLMTPAEEGAYIRLLAIEWGSDDCGLPNDDKELAILSRLGEGWFNGASTKIRKCFIEKGTRLYNKRLLQERKKQEIWREKSREGGIISGRLRKNSKLDPERWLNHPSAKNSEGYNKSKGRMVERPFNSSSSFSSSKKNNIGRSQKQTDPRVKEFFNYWTEIFQKETGQPYVFSYGKEGKLIKDLLQVHLIETLQESMRAFFQDEQCKRRGLTIGIFYQEINRLVSLKRKSSW
jgi:uncharacterized protein YdaU (DUF1376 family)